MIIPVAFGQSAAIFSGASLPDKAAVVFGHHITNTLTVAETAEAISGALEDTIMHRLCNTVTLEKVVTKWGPTATGPSAEFAGAVPGLLAGTPAYPEQCMLVRKHTALGGKKHRGRFYWPGMRRADINDDGTIDPAEVGEWTDASRSFLTAMSALDLGLALLHTTAGDPDDITDVTAEAVIATQRRRLR